MDKNERLYGGDRDRRECFWQIYIPLRREILNYRGEEWTSSLEKDEGMIADREYEIEI